MQSKIQKIGRNQIYELFSMKQMGNSYKNTLNLQSFASKKVWWFVFQDCIQMHSGKIDRTPQMLVII